MLYTSRNENTSSYGYLDLGLFNQYLPFISMSCHCSPVLDIQYVPCIFPDHTFFSAKMLFRYFPSSILMIWFTDFSLFRCIYVNRVNLITCIDFPIKPDSVKSSVKNSSQEPSQNLSLKRVQYYFSFMGV